MSLSLCKNHSYAVLSEFSREAIVPVRHLLLLANIVTTSKAPVTSSVAPVTTSLYITAVENNQFQKKSSNKCHASSNRCLTSRNNVC